MRQIATMDATNGLSDVAGVTFTASTMAVLDATALATQSLLCSPATAFPPATAEPTASNLPALHSHLIGCRFDGGCVDSRGYKATHTSPNLPGTQGRWEQHPSFDVCQGHCDVASRFF